MKKVDDMTTDELRAARAELERERMKLADERAAYRRQLRNEARRDAFMEEVARRAASVTEPLARRDPRETDRDGESDLIVSFTDIHHGIEIDNAWNAYDSDVLERRLAEYLDEIEDIQRRHGSRDAHVWLSELISGIIHPTLRIENNMDAIDQVITACEFTAAFLAELARSFRTIHVYMAPGNHGRVNPNKDLDVAHENFDNLILPFLAAKTAATPNIKYHKNEIEQSLAIFSVRGKLCVAAHGDRDRMKTAADKLAKFLGRRPDIILLGHMHVNAMLTDGDTKVIQAGCMSGPDEYCLGKRIRNKPEQAVAVVSRRGLECVYDVKLEA